MKEITHKLLNLNVNEFTEAKGGLTYLSWARAWQELLGIAPDSTYTILKNEDGLPCFGNKDFGYMVYTSLTVNGLTRSMWLAVMDNRNKSILNPKITDINKTVMRCLTKNISMFGLGLYIYSGEDLPSESLEVREIKELKAKIMAKLRTLDKEPRTEAIARLKADPSLITEEFLSKL